MAIKTKLEMVVFYFLSKNNNKSRIFSLGFGLFLGSMSIESDLFDVFLMKTPSSTYGLVERTFDNPDERFALKFWNFFLEKVRRKLGKKTKGFFIY